MRGTAIETTGLQRLRRRLYCISVVYNIVTVLRRFLLSQNMSKPDCQGIRFSYTTPQLPPSIARSCILHPSPFLSWTVTPPDHALLLHWRSHCHSQPLRRSLYALTLACCIISIFASTFVLNPIITPAQSGGGVLLCITGSKITNPS